MNVHSTYIISLFIQHMASSRKRPRSRKQRIQLGPTTDATPPYHLQNVVATFYLGIDRIDLRRLAQVYPFVEYNPSKFAAATVRIREPRTTALIFASGKMVCTGAKTELAARLASRKYVRVLQRFNVPVSFCDFEIQNIVASAYIGRTMRLMELSQQFGPYVSYEPDLFPGLVFRTTNPKLVFLIFRSGKVVITGAKSRKDIDNTFARLYHNVLKNFFDVEGSTRNSSEYRSQTRLM